MPSTICEMCWHNILRKSGLPDFFLFMGYGDGWKKGAFTCK